MTTAHHPISGLRLLLFLATILLTLSMGAQGNSSEERSRLLEGTWELDINKTLSALKSSSRDYYDSLKEEKKSAIRSSFGTRRVTFSPDGSYAITSGTGQLTGTWELYGDGETLAIFPDGGTAPYEQWLISVGTSNLELGLHTGSTEGQLFHTWHMKRPNK